MDKSLSTLNSEIRLFVKRSLMLILAVIGCNLFLLLLVVSGPAKDTPEKPARSAKSIGFFGSSNVGYNFDYERIPNSKPIGIEEPHGLFIGLMELEKSIQQGDVVICDVLYSWYAPDRFCPASYFFYKKVTLEYYVKLAGHYPVLFVKHVLASGLFNISLLEYLYNKFSSMGKSGASSPPKAIFDFSPKRTYVPMTSDAYLNCTNKYIKADHFIFQRYYTESHINRVKKIFAEIEKEKNVKLYFKYPELNKDNHDINKQLVQSIKTNFNPINSFEEWPDSLMYDQWYHLNNCGRQLNTDNIMEFLKRNNCL